MAQTIVAENDMERLSARAFEVFCDHRSVNIDDALLIVLVEDRAPELAARALALMDADQRLSFSMAFKAVRMCNRYMDEEPVREVRYAA